MPSNPGQTPIPPDSNYTRRDGGKSVFKELGIEFLVELLLFIYPYGADQMNLPHNFWLGLGCWIVGSGIAIRMFWIFPLWADRLSVRWKMIAAFLALAGFVLLLHKPVLTAHAKWVQEHETAAAQPEPTRPQTIQPPAPSAIAPAQVNQVPAKTKKRRAPPSSTEKVSNAAGSATFLDDEGKIDQMRIRQFTIKGSPAPGTNVTGIKIGPNAKGGNLTVDNGYMYLNSNLVPAAVSAGSDFHSRLSELRKELSAWENDNPNGPMSDFHHQFSGRLELIAQQLRECDPFRAHRIYGREKDEVDDTAMIYDTISDLWELDQELPEDEQQIRCANK
jgi:hypothetical protein